MLSRQTAKRRQCELNSKGVTNYLRAGRGDNKRYVSTRAVVVLQNKSPALSSLYTGLFNHIPALHLTYLIIDLCYSSSTIFWLLSLTYYFNSPPRASILPRSTNISKLSLFMKLVHWFLKYVAELITYNRYSENIW